MSYETKFYEINLKCHGDDWDDIQELVQEADKEIAELKETISGLIEKSAKLTGRE